METPQEYSTQETPDQYEDASNDHAYFAMLPNMLDDLLDPYQYRLYAHIKRVCGEKGKCWQSTETIAKVCRMSTGKVSEAKRDLVKIGLISITEKKRKAGGRPYHHIRIIDIWNRNIIHCSQKPSSQDEQASSRDEVKKTPPLNKTPEQGADAPHAPPDDEWPTEPAPAERQGKNPAQERLERMRAEIGDDPFSVGAHCQEAQEREGQWTIPVHKGLSPACAVFKEATGYSPAKAVRDDIDASIPNNEDALHNWYKVAHGWILSGYKYTNVGGMLDWYAEGRVSMGKPKDNGRHDGRNGGQPEPTPAFEFVEPDWLGGVPL